MPALRRPSASAVSTKELLAGVNARIVEQSEESKLGRLLAEAMPVPPLPATSEVALAPQWPAPLLESETGRIVGAPVRSRSDVEWARVRGAILATVANDTLASRRWWAVGLASAALVAVALLIAPRATREVPRIVFRDLDAVDVAAIPGFEFAVDVPGASR